MNLQEDNTMTVEEETEKTRGLYPNLKPFIPTAPPNIYQEPTYPLPGAKRSTTANDFRLHKLMKYRGH
jgi:hypothetical protein